jgi:hypothetical protein
MAVDEIYEERLAREEENREAAEQEAYNDLYSPAFLMRPTDAMKAYVWGSFTVRDIVCLAISFGPPLLIVYALTGGTNIPALIIGALFGIPMAALTLSHKFIPLQKPIEERVKRYFANKKKAKSLVWDKTRDSSGDFTMTSTQRAVPVITFDNRNHAFVHSDGTGGFCALKVTAQDQGTMSYAELDEAYSAFATMLNVLLDSVREIPIQIFVKSRRVDVAMYVQQAKERAEYNASVERKCTMLRARKHAQMLSMLGSDAVSGAIPLYSYEYYIIVIYRSDCEEVGNDTLEDFRVKRERMKEGMNPLAKKAKEAEAAQMSAIDIGKSKDELAKEMNERAKWSDAAVAQELDNRKRRILETLHRAGGSLRMTEVGTAELARLIYGAYHADWDLPNEVLTDAMDERLCEYDYNVAQEYSYIYNPQNKKGAAGTEDRTGRR